MEVSNAQLVRRFWQGINEEGKPPLEICDEAIEINNPPEFPVRGKFTGHDGVRQWLDQAFDVVDELRVEVDDVIQTGDDDTVVMLLRLCGVAAHSRIPIDQTWAAIGRVKDGKLAYAQGFVSRRSALREAGLRD